MTNEELAGLKNLFFYIGNLSHRAWDDPKNVRAVCERIESYAKQGQQKIDEIRRLGAAVSASPQPTKGCAQQWRMSGKLYAANTEHRFWTDERVEYFMSQFFAAAPAQERWYTKEELHDALISRNYEPKIADELAGWIADQLELAYKKGKERAQEQPASHPKTVARMRDGKPVEIQNDPDVIHPEHPGPDCGEKDYPRPPKKA